MSFPPIAPQETEEKLKKKIRELTLKEEEKLTQTKASSLGLSYINLIGLPISQEALSLISQEEAEAKKIICFFKNGGEVKIGVTSPENPALDEISARLQKEHHLSFRIYLISPKSLTSALELYKSLPKIRLQKRGVEIEEKDFKKWRKELKSLKELEEKLKGVPLGEVIAFILAQALEARASDIHIEAEEKNIKLRFRIDGVLYPVANLDKTIWPRIISRIKLLSGLKINIQDRPQDGRFTIYLTNETIDVRVSALPTAWGESLAIRLLMSSRIGVAFEDLGLRGLAQEILAQEIRRPNGMIVTTGPTGSGKTTTLYGILNKLNKPETKIIALEDPIEYKLKGINQSQVDEARGYTFAQGLRSIMRQDPDIVMVGEMRDGETVEIAINAALTGHLVISTLHTNSAAATIPRFFSLGAKPFLLAPALNVIIAQRLVRRLCGQCKKETELEKETGERVKKILSQISLNLRSKADLKKRLTFYTSSGCPRCQEIGYQGRIGIYEVLQVEEEIKKVILSGNVSEYDLEKLAQKKGMLTMVQDGLLKALDGITSLEEVFRVTE